MKKEILDIQSTYFLSAKEAEKKYLTNIIHAIRRVEKIPNYNK